MPKQTSTTNPEMKETKPKKTRNRIALSCSICRSRKVKCSKDKPHCKECQKAGVAHLCTYLDQPWAAQSQEQITKDHELKILKERIKSLEDMLSKVHNTNTAPLLNALNSGQQQQQFSSRSGSNEDVNSNSNGNIKLEAQFTQTSNSSMVDSPVALSNGSSSNEGNIKLMLSPIATASEQSCHSCTSNSQRTNSNIASTANTNSNVNETGICTEKYNNDELDLTKKFDMLHLKNTGTVHLGATHWLAIMKGDPYLKLLWSHIFTIREKISEWHKKQAHYYNNQLRKMSHTNAIMATANQGHCPVTQATGTAKCPVTHMSGTEMPEISNAASIQRTETPVGQQQGATTKQVVSPSPAVAVAAAGKCPFDHTKMSKQDMLEYSKQKNNSGSNTPVNSKVPTIQNITNGAGKCPVMHSEDPMSGDATSETKTGEPCGKQSESSLKTDDTIVNFDSDCIQKVIDELNCLLPPQRMIALLVDKFFKFLYPAIPILDEQSFKSQIYHIIQAPQSSGKQNVNIKIYKQLDYCTLGILVIILRLTWLSLPSNGCEIDLGIKMKTAQEHKPKNSKNKNSKGSAGSQSMNKEEELLKKHEISATTVNLVRKYLVRFDEISSFSNKNVNITTVQFAIFYKMYLSACPEGSESSTTTAVSGSTGSSFTSTGHDNETHQVLLSSIVQMAFSCGLHRDPDNFPQLNTSDLISLPNTQHLNLSGTLKQTTGTGSKKRKNAEAKNSNSNKSTRLNKEAAANTEKLKHTWRKTWFFIVSLDVQQSLSLGTPRLLRNLGDFSDTKLPCSSKIDYVNDIKELIIVKNFTLFFQIDLCIIAVLNHILNVSLAKTVRKFELDELIKALELLSYGQNMQGEENTNIKEIVEKLISNGLLFTSEASALASTVSMMMPTAASNRDEYSSYDAYGSSKVEDTVYTLPVMKKILEASSIPSSIKKEKESATSKKLDLPQEITTRALFFSKHLTIRMLLYLLNYILFTFYEPKGNEDPDTLPLTGHYAQNALKFAMDGFRSSVLFFVNNKKNSEMSGPSTSIFNHMEVLLSPQCLDACHRSLQFMICLILRARCGPLTGLNEAGITSGSSGTSSACSSEEESESNPSSHKNKKDYDSMLFDENEKLELNDDLGELLFSRMELFYKLTKQVSVKYNYATKMTRSTGFFLTLLKNPANKKKDTKKGQSGGGSGIGGSSSSGGCPFNRNPDEDGSGKETSNPPVGTNVGMHNYTLPKLKNAGGSNMSSFFKNIPSLIISAGGDQLKRCPVYQDAVGYLPNDMQQAGFQRSPSNVSFTVNNGNGNGNNNGNNFSLPKMTSSNAYQPVTYSTITRRTSDIRNEELNNMNKRRKLSTTDLLAPSPEAPAITPKQRMLSDTLPLPTNNNGVVGKSPIPMNVEGGLSVKVESPAPFAGLQTANIQHQHQHQQALPGNGGQINHHPNSFNTILAANQYVQDQAQHYRRSFDVSPALMSESTSSSSVNYAPDFEEFLRQSTDVNGLIVNPSSIMEAVGFEDFKDPNAAFMNAAFNQGMSNSGLNLLGGNGNGSGNGNGNGNLTGTANNSVNFNLNNLGGIPTGLEFMSDTLGNRQDSDNNSVWIINEDFQGMENTGIESLNEIINGPTMSSNMSSGGKNGTDGNNNNSTLNSSVNNSNNVNNNASVPQDISSWE